MKRRQQVSKRPAGRASGAGRSSRREPRTPWGRWAKARRDRIEARRREREKRRLERQRARQLRRLRRRQLIARSTVFIGLMGLACGIGSLVLLLLGPPYPWQALEDVARTLQLSRALEARRERWERLGIHHYTVEVEYRGQEARCGPVEIEVRNGEIVNPPGPSEAHWFPASVCDRQLDLLTIEGAFEWLEQELGQFRPGRTYLYATFDPDFGYLTILRAGVYGEDPPRCCQEATWSNLRPLNDE